MKKLIILIIVLFSNSLKAQDSLKKYEKLISEENLRKNLTYISSDAMEGRDTGSEGQKKVADYIINIFKEYKLSPILKSADSTTGYLQKFDLYKTGWKESYIEINKSKKIFFKDYYPIGLPNIPEEQQIEVVYAGYGIKTEVYDDFKNLDIKNKAVMILEGEPLNKNGKFVFSTGEKSDWDGAMGNKKKQYLAYDLGAKYVFFVSKSSNNNEFNSLAAERKAVLSRFNRMTLEKNNLLEPTENAAFIISKNMAAEILNLKLKKLDKYISSAQPKKMSGLIKIKTSRGENVVETANILGFLEGTDKKDEVVVVSAHYDHVGIDDKGQIYNGADDDGSGTCAVIELAKAFATAKAEGHGPRRSILFLLVTGEEKGLLGSQYFTDIDPTIPLKKIMCDINIDMIGRIDKKHETNPKYVYLIGADKLSSELNEISITANKNSVNYDLDYTFNDTNDPNRFYYRSDHYNFAKNKIPVIFYFTGVHEDYHKPTDDVEKILFNKYADITKLIFNTVWELSNRNNKIIVDSNKP